VGAKCGIALSGLEVEWEWKEFVCEGEECDLGLEVCLFFLEVGVGLEEGGGGLKVDFGFSGFFMFFPKHKAFGTQAFLEMYVCLSA
jgi:hypothetical protein